MPPFHPLFARLLIIGAAASLPHRAAAQCADDDPGLVTGLLQIGQDLAVGETLILLPPPLHPY